MKDSNIIFLSAVVCWFFFAGQAMGSDGMSWQHDGTVHNSNKRHIKLELQNIYSGLEYDNALFVIGYKIDDSGINHPTVASISGNLEQQNYWSFQQDLQGVFVYKNAVYINDASGEVFQYKPPNWIPSQITLKPDSKVVYTNDDLVACYPSSLLKSSTRTGACYSLSQGWSVQVNWQTVNPTICGDKLHVFEKNNDRKIVRALALKDGKMLHEKTVESTPTDLCNYRF